MHFLNLDIGLPIDELRGVIRQIRADGRGSAEVEVEVDAVNRRGRTIRVRVECSALADEDGVSGVLLVMEENLVGSSPS